MLEDEKKIVKLKIRVTESVTYYETKLYTWKALSHRLRSSKNKCTLISWHWS